MNVVVAVRKVYVPRTWSRCYCLLFATGAVVQPRDRRHRNQVGAASPPARVPQQPVAPAGHGVVGRHQDGQGAARKPVAKARLVKSVVGGWAGVSRGPATAEYPTFTASGPAVRCRQAGGDDGDVRTEGRRAGTGGHQEPCRRESGERDEDARQSECVGERGSQVTDHGRVARAARLLQRHRLQRDDERQQRAPLAQVDIPVAAAPTAAAATAHELDDELQARHVADPDWQQRQRRWRRH